MTEDYILQRIPQRIKELGYHNYHVRYRDVSVPALGSVTFPAFNEVWYIINDPSGIIVSSDYGIYDSTGDYIFDNIHQHRGEIQVTNPQAEHKRIKFIQVVIIN
jgi:hypothetical protein